MDLSPLLETLAKVSNNRILPSADVSREGDFNTAKIPVRYVLDQDRTERALRRYAADWIRLNVRDVGVEARLETFPLGVTWDDEVDGQKISTPVGAAIVLSWWPKPPPTEHELIIRNQLRKKNRD